MTAASDLPTAAGLPAGLDLAPLRLEDAAEAAALMTDLEAVDGIEETVDEVDAREMLESPGFDPATDSLGVRRDGALIGLVWVTVGTSPDAGGFIRASIGGGVHGDHRRQGIGAHLLAVGEKRAAELMADRHPGMPAHLRVGGGVSRSTVRHLLDAEGYAPVRTWLDLSRELPGEELAEPQVEGVVLAAPREEDGPAVREAHIAAFRDHWGAAPIDEARWEAMWGSAKSRHDLATIARAEDDGTVLGYVLTSVYEPGSLYVALVGTVREARGRGIAQAALAHTIRRAAAAGEFREVTLEVDAESPTGATRLYERVGFRPVRERVTYEKDLLAAAPAAR